MTPQELKHIISDGLLSFPVTDFDAQGRFDARSYAGRLEWLAPYGASALFAAGGTGEFFSIAGPEYADIIRTAVQGAAGKVPILAGVGGPTGTAIEMAKAAQAAGAQGLLLLPHYLTEASDAGIAEHVSQICRAVDIGVVFYHRAQSHLSASKLVELADRHANLIGFKDGVGNIETMVTVRRKLGDRFAYLGGLPTAEVYAEAYRAMGVPVYSSAVFNFIPKTALEFYHAVAKQDQVTTGRLLDQFFLPYLEIRNRCPGYAVSIIKAGVRLVGKPAGPVRPPLTDLTGEECDMLQALITALGTQ